MVATNNQPDTSAKTSRGDWPLLGSIAALLIAVAQLVRLDWTANEHHLIYSVDDTYIGMAMAKNIVLHGVYGVCPYHQAGASSSIIWPWLLAIPYKIFGVNEYVPLVYNVIAGIFLIWVCNKVLLTTGLTAVNPWLRLLSLLAIIVATPLPVMILIGMEHIWHAALEIVLAVLATKLILTPGDSDRTLLQRTAVIAAVTTGFRYEGLVCVGIVAVLLAVRRKFREGAIVLASGLAPVLLYGVIAVTHHEYFLPNSVLIKAKIHNMQAVGFSTAISFCQSWTPQLLPLVGAVIIVFAMMLLRRKPLLRFETVFLFIFVVVAAAHIATSGNYNFFRYQAYINAFGALAACVGLGDWYAGVRPGKKSKAFGKMLPSLYYAGLMIILIALSDPQKTCGMAVQASQNIYQQQYRNGLFLKQYYNGAGVVLNDIGAVDYLADIDMLDIEGLGSTEYTRMVLEHRKLHELLNLINQRGIKIAVVYRDWLTVWNPNWAEIGDVSIDNNLVCGDATVAYVAMDPSERVALKQHMLDAHFDTSSPTL